MDPFWKEEAVDLSLIKKAHYSDDKVKASSWVALYGMMIRVDEFADYTRDKETAQLFAGAFRKLHTLTVSSFNLFHHYVTPPQKPINKDAVTFKQDSAFQSGIYCINKIKSLKTGASMSVNHGNGRTGNGLMILQKRIWETLLCCLMMQQSLFQEDLEHCLKTGTYPTRTMQLSKLMSENERSQSLFKQGDLKDTKNAKAMKNWGQDRLAAFGSMAIYFLYGAAGWWQFLTDSHNYNQKDVWVLVHMAKGKSDWIYNKGHLIQRRPEDTPWYRIDSFVRWLLIKTNMHVRISDKVDWIAAREFWGQHVTEHNVARLALQDVLAEVCSKTPLKSMNFEGEPAPDVEFDATTQVLVDQARDHLTTGWKGVIEGATEARAHTEATDQSSHPDDSPPDEGTSEAEVRAGNPPVARVRGSAGNKAHGNRHKASSGKSARIILSSSSDTSSSSDSGSDSSQGDTQSHGATGKPSTPYARVNPARNGPKAAPRKSGRIRIPSDPVSSSRSDSESDSSKSERPAQPGADSEGSSDEIDKDSYTAASKDVYQDEEDENTDPHRSDSDGGVEERLRKRHEHPYIKYSAAVKRG
jgi:hypothetical protein